MSQLETSRLVTFETDKKEMLAIMAGRSEMDRRTIFQGHADGRYAVVPVDDLVSAAEDNTTVDETPEVEEMQLVGTTVDVPEHGDATVSIAKDGQQQERMDQRGTYGLLWIPFE